MTKIKKKVMIAVMNIWKKRNKQLTTHQMQKIQWKTRKNKWKWEWNIRLKVMKMKKLKIRESKPQKDK